MGYAFLAIANPLLFGPLVLWYRSHHVIYAERASIEPALDWRNRPYH